MIVRLAGVEELDNASHKKPLYGAFCVKNKFVFDRNKEAEKLLFQTLDRANEMSSD
ncbi:hypothetical protein GCM10028803_58020 [Larkinella knui]